MPCILPWLKSSGTCPVCRYVHVLVDLVQYSYSSHRSAVTHLSLNLIIILHGQVLDQILTVVVVVVVHAGLTLALMRVGAVGLNLEAYSIRFLVGSAVTTLAVTMIALGLDSAGMSVDLLIQRHRGGIGATIIIMIVTCLGLGRKTLISIRKCMQKNSLKDVVLG